MTGERVVVVIVVCVGAAMYFVPAAVLLNPVLADDKTANVSAPPQPTPNEESRLAFSEVAEKRGLDYEGVRMLNGTQGMMSRSGVYVSDYDNDLDPDVLMVGGERPVLYENDGGEFVRSGALPDLGGNTTYRSALFVDYDNDGLDDLVFTAMDSEPVLLHNNGEVFTIREGAFDAVVDVPVTVTAADYDRDGCVDVFVTQNGDWIDSYPARVQSNRTKDNGKRNYLFRGTCGPSFERVNETGIDGEHWSLSASFVDFTGDGLPDIHVANDFAADVLYVNQGDGTFAGREIPRTNRNGMASEVEDIDGDGDMDIFVSNIYWSKDVADRLDSIGIITSGSIGNNLLLNDGDGNFTDRAPDWGIRNGRWGWAAVMTDLDNDGDRDLFHTTRKQFVPEEMQDRWGKAFEYFERSRIFERVGPEQFVARSAPDVGFVKTDGRGVGQLDFDGDGYADLAVANAGGPARLYRNDARNGSALQVKIRPSNNETVLGSTVTVITREGTYHAGVTAKADFLSQDTRTLHFGLGDAERVETIRVEYPSGEAVTFQDYCVDQRIVVRGEEVVNSEPVTPANASRTPAC